MIDTKDREKQVKKLFKTIQKNGSNNLVNFSEIDTSDYLLVKAENSNLKKEIAELESKISVLENSLVEVKAENIALKEKTKKNSRNAGRKKMYLTDKFQVFVTLYEQKLSMKEISEKMGISLRSAYYYRKECQLPTVQGPVGL